MVRSLDNLDVDDDASIVVCRECDTAWVFEPHSEAAYDFDPTQHGHADHETESPIAAERYLRGHEWIVDHEDSVERKIFHCRSDAEKYVERSNGLFGWFFDSQPKDPWLREIESGLPSIREYRIDVNVLSSDERSRLGSRVARAVLDVSRREFSLVRIMGITPYIRDQDPDAFAQLVRKTGIEFDEDWLDDLVEVTESVTDAILQLFTDGLIKVIFYDTEGREVFARHEKDITMFYIDHTRYETLVEELLPADRERIGRGGWE